MEQGEWGPRLFLSSGPACVCPSFLHGFSRFLVPLPPWRPPICMTKGQLSTEDGTSTRLSHPHPPYLQVAGTCGPLDTGGKCWSFPVFSRNMTPWVRYEDLRKFCGLKTVLPQCITANQGFFLACDQGMIIPTRERLDQQEIVGGDGSLQSQGRSHQNPSQLLCSRMLSTSDDPSFHTGLENTGTASQSPSPLPRQDFTWPAVDVSVTLVTALHRGETKRGQKKGMRHARLPCPVKRTFLMPQSASSAPGQDLLSEAIGRCILMNKEAKFPQGISGDQPGNTAIGQDIKDDRDGGV